MIGELKWRPTDTEGLDGVHKATATQIGGSHYKDMPQQLSIFITANKLGWCEGNAIKYICRHHIKGGVDDIDKAIHYLQLLKEIEYGSTPVWLRTETDPPF